MNEDSKASKFSKFLSVNPGKILLGFLAIFFLVTFGASKLVPNFGYRIWFNPNSYELNLFDQFEAKFGSDETTVIVINSENGIFDVETSKTIVNLTRELWKTPDVIRVSSLSNFNWTHSIDDDIEVEPLIPDDIRLTQNFLDERKEIALGNRNVNGYLVSKDGKSAVFYLRLRPLLKQTPDFDKVTNSVIDTLKKYEGKLDHKFYYTGSPPLNYSFKSVTQKDMQQLIPLVIVICLVFLMFTIRRISGVLISLLTIFLSIGATMGFAGWVGLEINTVSGMVPQFMIAVSLAVIVHLLVSFYQFYNSGMEKNEALIFAIDKNFKPTILTALSTSFGFFSFLSAGIPSIGTMGAMAGFGTLLSWFVSYFFMIPLLFLIPIKRKSQSRKKDIFVASEKSIIFTQWLFKNRVAILIVGTILSISSFFLASKVTINSDPFEYFDHTVQVRMANEFMEDKVGGSMGGEFIIDSGVEEGIKNPVFLRKVQKLQDWLETFPFITKTISIVDIIKETNKSLHGDDMNYYKLPGTKEEVAQQIFLYSMSLPQGMDLNDRMTIKNDSLRLTAMWNIHDSKRILKFKAEVESKAAELGLKAEGTGKGILWQTITKPIAYSFITSVSIALILITILLFFGLKSLKISILALIPNALPIIFGGAMLYLLDIYLDIGTVIVGGVTLGIAVDDTIHFLASFRKHIESGKTAKEAIALIFTQTVPALVVTTLVLVASFGTFIFGSFIPNQSFGKMVAIILSFALIADILFLPALLMAVGEKFFISKRGKKLVKEKLITREA